MPMLKSLLRNKKLLHRTVPPNSASSFTFKVDPVDFSNRLPSLTTAEDILFKRIILSGEYEDFSHRKDLNANFLSDYIPGIVGAVHTAYQSHYTLNFSVSDFIILIGQGLGAHINANSENLRKHFVDFEGKQAIHMRRDDFVMGQQNDWSTVFGDFAKEIKGKVKPGIYDVVIDDTSVATKTSRIVSEITLMDAMKSYFHYGLESSCGIPEITLEGKREDWQKLKEKVRKLVEMNKEDCLELKWWLDELVPVVDKICEAGIERKVNEEFWGSIYKYRGFSGGPFIGGWIIRFLPYLTIGRNMLGSITTEMIPSQICEVPFVWSYRGSEIYMKVTAGFLGAEFNRELLQVKPAHFWCVTKREKSSEG